MGLDMFVWRCKPADVVGEGSTDVQLTEGKFTELHYWRKHPNLHGWMEKLYREKGGQKEDFNCTTVRLEKEDLLRLKKDIKAKKLPQTSGFFFGQSYNNEEERAEDLQFIEDALQALEEGDVIFYDSWW